MKKIIIFLIILISLLTINCAYAEENGTNPNDNQNNINPTTTNIEDNTNTTDNPDNEKYYWKNPYYPNDEYYFYKNGSVFDAKNNQLMNYALNKDQVDFYLKNGYFSYALAYIKAHGGNLTYDEVYNAEGVIGNDGKTSDFIFYNNGSVIFKGQHRVDIEEAEPVHRIYPNITNGTENSTLYEKEYSPFGYIFDTNGSIIPDPEFPYSFSYTTHIDGTAIWPDSARFYHGALYYNKILESIGQMPNYYNDPYLLKRFGNGQFYDSRYGLCATNNTNNTTTNPNNTLINKTNQITNNTQKTIKLKNTQKTNETIPNKTNIIDNNTQKTIKLENTYQTNNTNQKQTNNNTNQTNNTAANNKKNTKPAQNTQNLIFIPALACLLAPIGLYRKNKK